MGNTSYSVNNRSTRADSLGYMTASMDSIFEQNTKRMIHESMDPKGITFREARDSDTHPNTVPIILALDVTGSMRKIPHELIKTGLPKMMDGIISQGVKDPALLFLAIGDHVCDHYPLQVGQFESGDEELDTWLTRTYLEGGGGGNEGESYLLAWYFAANHTITDAWEKRKNKGFLFTVGDEPCLENLPKNVVTALMGAGEAGGSANDLLEAAQKTFEVYHLHIMEGQRGASSLGYWKELLGDNCIQIDDHRNVADAITDIVTKKSSNHNKTERNPSKSEDIIL